MKSLEEMSVAELEDLKQGAMSEVDEATERLTDASRRVRALSQAIYEKTPRDLSLNEVERLLGFKVNIVEGDKLWIHE